MSTFVRVQTHRGCTVHLATCRHVQRGRWWPWLWAEGRSLSEVFEKPWNIPCKTCRPDEAKP